MTTVKNVIEAKGKQNKTKLKSLIRSHSANKVDNSNREGIKEKKQSKRIHRTNQNIRIINVFLSHCCQSPFPCWESQSTSPLQDALQHCAELWICCRGSSDSNLVLHLCVLVSNVHSYQNQCVFFFGSSQCPFIYFIDTESAQLIVQI